jgi:nitronate monooxygenase
MTSLQRDYPWSKAPLIANGPMRLIALPALAIEVSNAGGLGFLGVGSDASQLGEFLKESRALQEKSTTLSKFANGSDADILPVGIGFLLWAGDDLLQTTLPLIRDTPPAAIWLYAHSHISQAKQWTEATREATRNRSKIWIQVGTVAEAVEATAECRPDVLVIQGQDAGGHGLLHGAGIMPLFPEADDAVTALCAEKGIAKPVLLAAGGIMEGRGVAAALALGAEGVVMGTRYLASTEAHLAKGYQDAVLAADDGGVKTARGTLYDRLRGTTDWPSRYGGRGVLNESWFDDARGLSFEENKKQYDEAVAESEGEHGWGKAARLTTYAGSGVGLARKVQPAAEITVEVREEARKFLRRTNDGLS